MATKKSDGKRTQKVADEVRSELMGLLLTGAVHDPVLTQLSVSAVLMTDDLRLAKIYVRTLDMEPSAQTQKTVLRGLERAKGFLRREVAQRLSLRYAPELRFHWDESIDRGRHMEALLQEIKSSDGDSNK